jgi:hypothetical protein
MALKRLAPAFIAGWLSGFPGLMPPAIAASEAPPAPVEAAGNEETLVYIFSGVLTGGGETYSGTLVAAADGPEFELKLAKGATCDANKLEPDKGLLRLPETPCSDGRKLKALFVYQPGSVLRVYGTVGDQRFSTEAHALPSGATEAPPAPSAAPPADLMDKGK